MSDGRSNSANGEAGRTSRVGKHRQGGRGRRERRNPRIRRTDPNRGKGETHVLPRRRRQRGRRGARARLLGARPTPRSPSSCDLVRDDRSDTLDFPTTAVAGDMGHDLAASAMRLCHPPPSARRPRHRARGRSGSNGVAARNAAWQSPWSDTLGSTARQHQHHQGRFFVAVTAEWGELTSPIAVPLAALAEGSGRSASTGAAGRAAAVRTTRVLYRRNRPRSDTLKIYSSLARPGGGRAGPERHRGLPHTDRADARRTRPARATPGVRIKSKWRFHVHSRKHELTFYFLCLSNPY